MNREIQWLKYRIYEVENTILPECSDKGVALYEDYLQKLREKYAQILGKLCPTCNGKGYV